MSKPMLVILALALAAPFAGLVLAEVVSSPSRATGQATATATDIDRALHAALPTGEAGAAGLRVVTLRE